MWDSYCVKFMTYWKANRETPNHDIILTQAKIKVALGFID